MKIILISIIATLYCSSINAQNQEAVVSGGGYADIASGSVSWTIGQTFVSTIINNEVILTQGMQQSNLTYKILSNQTSMYIEMSVYPNPTPDLLYLKSEKLDNLHYEIYTITGNLILSKQISSELEEISLIDYPTATYIVKVIQNQKFLKSFQVIKQ